MTAVTVGTIPSRTSRARPGVASRIWEAIVRARMHEAEREIARHRYLLPAMSDERDATHRKDVPAPAE